MTFFLILVGGHTTTSGAGMAFADWPLSHGSLNPAGWWENMMQRLEHGHRMTAELVGLLVGVLTAWVWRSKWSLPAALVGSLVLAVGAHFLGAPPRWIAHVGLWSAALIFVGMLLATLSAPRAPAAVRWISFAAFVGVLAQAVLGGLRVTTETGGDIEAATTFRIVHGCCAQIELGLLVVLAAWLSPKLQEVSANPRLRSVAKFAWCSAALIFVQLIVGAAMRHFGAGLAIPTFPRATPEGAWLPLLHNRFVDLNFAHTRIGALLVTLATLTCFITTLRKSSGDAPIVRPALLLLSLLVSQLALGMLVIWKMRPPILTTLHVVNGAALLSAALLLAVRAGQAARIATADPRVENRVLEEVTT